MSEENCSELGAMQRFKICTSCSKEKSFEDFHKHKKSPHGIFSHCKSCVREKEKRQKAEKIANGTWAEISTKKNARDIKRHLETPIKSKAQQIFRWHIKCKKIIRLPCEICGTIPAQGHHDDYDKPLDVRWLCRTHHSEWHAKNGPGANGDLPKNGDENEKRI